MAPPQESPRVLGVCSGIGGIESGVQLALRGARVVGLVERDAYAANVLLARMEQGAMDPAPVWAGDLAEFPAAAWAGAVDLVCAGIPCQPYSVAGRKLRDEDARDLVEPFLRLVGDVGPSLVFVEEVGAFLCDEGAGRLLAGLAALGFDADWVSLRASDVGAPHRRERVFILAHRDGGRLEVERLAERAGLEGSRGREPDGRRDDWPLDWPPGPGEARWDAVLDLDPTLAPALPDVRGVADGVSEGLDDTDHRIDRLRCLGNAVVPQQAAAALRELLERVRGRMP